MSSRKKPRGRRRESRERTGRPEAQGLGIQRLRVPTGAEALAIQELAELGVVARIDVPGWLRFSGSARQLAAILGGGRCATHLHSRLAAGSPDRLAAAVEALGASTELPSGATIALDSETEIWRGRLPAERRAATEADAGCIGVLRVGAGRKGESALFLDRLIPRGEVGDASAAAALRLGGSLEAGAVALFPGRDPGVLREGWVRSTSWHRPPLLRAPGAGATSLVEAFGQLAPSRRESDAEWTIFTDDAGERARLEEWGGEVELRGEADFPDWVAHRIAGASPLRIAQSFGGTEDARVAERLRLARAASHLLIGRPGASLEPLFPGEPPAGSRAVKIEAASGERECLWLPGGSAGLGGPRRAAPGAREEVAIGEESVARVVAIVAENDRLRRRWPERQGTDAYRLYDREVPEVPMVVDRYGPAAHITVYPREEGGDRAREAQWIDAVGRTLGLDPTRLFVKRKERRQGGRQHEVQSRAGVRTEVREGGLRLLVNLSDYVDTGLFLDHRITRERVRGLIGGGRFLNLFCYTGAFTVAAAAGGARSSVSVDTSTPYLEWARENLRLNGLDRPEHRLIRGDALAVVRDLPPEDRFELALVDPPTRSNRHGGALTWDVQRDHAVLLRAVAERLAPGGAVLFSTNYRRFRLDEGALDGWAVEEWTPGSIPPDIGDRRIHRCWRLVPPRAG